MVIIHLYIYTHTYIHIYVCIYIYVCLYVYRYVHISIYVPGKMKIHQDSRRKVIISFSCRAAVLLTNDALHCRDNRF